MPAEDLNTLFAAYVRCAVVATFVKPNKARPRRKQKEKRTADGPPGVFLRASESQTDHATLWHQHYLTPPVQSGAAESDWEPEREHSVPTHRAPGGALVTKRQEQHLNGWMLRC